VSLSWVELWAVITILGILAAEEQIKTAAEMFHQMLMAASTFGGETVHTFKTK